MFHVEASDKDYDYNARLEYKLKCVDDVTNCPFVMNQNGDVTLSSGLDRETKDQYKVAVTVSNLFKKCCLKN